jgi:hypothetical protein
MSDSWVWAVSAVVGGIVFGAIAGRGVRTYLASDKRRSALNEMAPITGIFLFWISVATGIILAVAATSPDTLEPLPTRVLAWLPNALTAGILLILGYAFGATVGAAVGQAASRAGGRRQPAVEQAVRSAIFAAAAVLALGQLGVNTTILNILIAAAAFGLAAALAGIAIVGSKAMARSIATGRSLASQLPAGQAFRTADFEGTVVEAGATHLVVAGPDERRFLVPWSDLEHGPIELLD